MPFSHSFRIQGQDTIQIRSRHGSYSVTYSDLLFRIQSQDTFQIHSRHGSQSIIHSEFKVKIQFRSAPDTDAILILIQFQLTDAVQQSFLDGIYKPISNNFLSYLQMESLSPFPISLTITLLSANFWAL